MSCLRWWRRQRALGIRLRTSGCVAAYLLQTTSATAVGVVVEISEEAEAVVDSQLARRLIRLELSDVDLPQVVGDRAQRQDREVVFVRLLRTGETLKVELWARGQPSGERRLDVLGTEQYQARRVALASAELARRLRESRILERQRFLKRHLRPATTSVEHPSYTLQLQAGAAIGVNSAVWPRSEALLVGPQLEVWARTESGLGIALFGSVYSTATAAKPTGAQWTEVGLRPSWSFELDSRVKLAVGTLGSVAVFDVGRSSKVPSHPESQQTWGARLAARADLEWWFKDNVALSLGPEVGLHLREVAVHPERTEDERVSIGGAWIGLGVRAMLRQ